MNFISRNYLRVVPLLIPLVIWEIARTYLLNVDAGAALCDVHNGYNCMIAIGYPGREFATWILPASIVASFSPIKFLKRWIIFTLISVFISILLVNSSDEGMFNGKETSAAFLAATISVVTVLWLVTHLFISWRKSKVKISS